MTVYQKKNGKYYAKYQVDGIRRNRLCTGATTRKEAEKLENQFKFLLQQEINGVIPSKVKKIRCSLKKLTDNFLQYSSINRKVHKQDKARIKVILDFFNGNAEADEIIMKNIEEFKAHLLLKGLSKATINLYLDIMRETYNLGIENEWIEKNPFAKKVKFKIEPRKIKYLNDKEIMTLFSKIDCNEMRDIITIALNSGLRRENILELKWSDLDFNLKIIDITYNKGNKHIKLPMTNTVYEVLSKRERASEYVFINPITKDRWHTTAFNKKWRELREKAGLNNFKFHGLRHTVGTKLAKEGMSPYVIKEILAHSDISTSMRYIHTASEDIQKGMLILNSYR